MSDTDLQFSTRDVPWGKLGVRIEHPVTAEEAMALAGADFTVELRQLHYEAHKRGAAHGFIPLKDRFGVIRTDTEEALGNVGSHYVPLQFRDAFRFIDAVDPSIVAAGTLKGGRLGFMVVEVPQDLEYRPLGIEHTLYLVLRTSHDGSRAVQVYIMPLNDSCMNAMALQSFGSSAVQSWSVRHLSTMEERLQEAQDTLTRTSTYADEYRRMCERLASVDVDLQEAENLLRMVLPIRAKTPELIDRIIHNGNHSATIPEEHRGNGWGLISSLTEVLDWQRDYRSQEARFQQTMNGLNARARNRLAGLLLARAGR